MFGIFLTVLYAIYAHFALGSTFIQIHEVAMDFLFRWYALCGILSTFLILFLIVAVWLKISFSTRINNFLNRFTFRRAGTLTVLAVVVYFLRYVLLLSGVYILQGAFYEGEMIVAKYIIGIIMVMIGLSSTSYSASHKSGVTVFRSRRR